jgi:hypothetical protein
MFESISDMCYILIIMRTCRECRIIQSSDQFQEGRRVCKSCVKIRTQKWHERSKCPGTPGFVLYKTKKLINAAKHRAIQKGLEFELEEYSKQIEDRIRKGKCEWSNIDFNMDCPKNDNPEQFRVPSIDRIDSKRGYTYDNIRIICWGWNSAFKYWGDEYFFKMIAELLKFKNSQSPSSFDEEILLRLLQSLQIQKGPDID